MFKSVWKPKQVHSDEESSMRSVQMINFINETEFKSVQTPAHAHTVERFIRTLKTICTGGRML